MWIKILTAGNPPRQEIPKKRALLPLGVGFLCFLCTQDCSSKNCTELYNSIPSFAAAKWPDKSSTLSQLSHNSLTSLSHLSHISLTSLSHLSHISFTSILFQRCGGGGTSLSTHYFSLTYNSSTTIISLFLPLTQFSLTTISLSHNSLTHLNSPFHTQLSLLNLNES